jgi:hydrogenase maturation protein HypF
MKTPPLSHTLHRQHLRVTGIVQGVGFRPFVYNLAQSLNLSGLVGNDNQGVFIEIEGDFTSIEHFLEMLAHHPPPLAHIESVSRTAQEPLGTTGFTIVHSQQQPDAHTLVSPDLCVCDDCLAELRNPADRRYGYPFINCTNCGPRLTIIRDLPYDRPLTTMAGFPMCADCQREYDDPTHRRFHAQPNACPVCGPRIWYVRDDTTDEQDAIHRVKEAFQQGKIIAIKGLGGFHLACDATNNSAIQTLRERKGRVDKPFAVMLRDLDAVRRYADVSASEEALLTSRQRPIVLLNRKEQTGLSPLVAPHNHAIGVMLPYTPLHHLLLDDTPLVMTSANYSGDPLVKDNDEAQQKLSHLADAFLLHNRDIQVRCDDSVVRVIQQQEIPLRRSRGYAPFPVHLPFPVKPILAVGGELKATFCVTNEQHAILSQHIGDMDNLETLHAFEDSVAHYLRLFRVQPEAVVCDLHPRYLSSGWAERYAESQRIPLIKVQHHHAHLAAVMAENGLGSTETVLGFCFDGTGYSPDHTIWGGEVLRTTYRDYQRLAYLKPIPLAGGDAAVKNPYRLALAYLWSSGLEWDEGLPCVQVVSAQEKRILRRQLERGINTVLTSSMGRLFDAIASLIGVRHSVTYEAQAAVELESRVDRSVRDTPYCFEWVESAGSLVLDPSPLLQSVIADLRANVPVGVMAARFHLAIADMIVQIGLHFRAKTGIDTIALSGGVFQNATLLEKTIQHLEAQHLKVIHHRIVPSNDGGIALGQAVLASVL